MKWAALFLLVPLTCAAQLPPLVEMRYCGEPQRDHKGVIYRNFRVLAKFKEIHPCPSNGNTSGACPGWAIDHVIPLACGGCDAVSNLQWLPNELKSAARSGKDRFERRIYEKDISCSGEK